MKMNGYVYKIVEKCNDTALYVGSTTQTPARRWDGHKSNSKTRHSKVYNYLNEHGIDNFKMVVLEHVTFENKIELTRLEEEYRLKLKPTLNMRRCFSGVDYENLSKPEYYRQYGEDNKETIEKKRREKLLCECGGTTRRDTATKHKKTASHKKKMILPFLKASLARRAFLVRDGSY